MQFLFVSTNHVVWLTSVPSSRLATLPLTLLRIVNPRIRDFHPLGTFISISKELYLPFKAHTNGLSARAGKRLRFNIFCIFDVSASIEV